MLNSCFLVELVRPNFIRSYHLVLFAPTVPSSCAKEFILFFLSARVCFCSDLNSSWKQDILCHFKLGCEFGAAARVEKLWRCRDSPHVGRSVSLHRGGQRVRQILVLALEGSSSGPLAPQPQQFKYGRVGRLDNQLCDWDREGRKLRRRVRNLGRRPLDRHWSISRTLPLARVSVCLQPSPAAAATNQFRYLYSSRLVRFKDTSPARNGSSADCRDFESGCACNLMSLLVSQVLPGDTVTRETDAMEKEGKLDGGHFLSLGCKSKLLGHQRARNRFSLGTCSQQRQRVRRRRRAVSAVLNAPGALSSLIVRTCQGHPSGEISLAGRIGFLSEESQTPSATFF